jgi:hypothetical protein
MFFSSSAELASQIFLPAALRVLKTELAGHRIDFH